MNGLEGGEDRRRRIPYLVAVGFAGLFSVALLFWFRGRVSPHVRAERFLAEARSALARSRFDRAEDLALRIDRGDACWAPGRLVAGEAATKSGRRDDAVKYYRDIPRDGSPASLVAVLSLAELSRDAGRLTDAERDYRYVLEAQPANAAAHARLAFVLAAVGRRWDALPHYLFLLQSDSAGLEDLVILGDLERPLEQGVWLRRCAESVPDDLLVQLGLAADALGEGRAAEARRLLPAFIARAPHLVAAQAMLGELLVDGDDAAFVKWHAGLPATADGNPDIWFVRGLWARRHGEPRVAARCFWETVRIAPQHRRGNYQLGQVLVSLGEAAGPEFAERARRLFELTQELDEVLRSQGQHEATLKRVVELLESTGRFWEACGWAAMASRSFPDADWPRTIFARLSAQLGKETPQTIVTANLALKHDLSGFPDHEELVRVARGPTREPAATPRPSIRFEEATDAGIEFAYFNGHEPATRGARMFEQTGGGVAVIDFDGDGWPDLLFTQGLEWKKGAAQPTPHGKLADCLYRNLAGQTFIDVTRQSCLVDGGFGQGCAAGDIDDDGFPDLYVANIGRNRLHHNNGDGTFTDVTETAGIGGETWTSSCVIVDLNADGLSDLFDVTYVTGPGVYEMICNGHACSPKTFEGLPDRLHLNRGDGTFELVPDATPASNSSKGLGIVAVDIHLRGRPALFITNDQVPNFLLQNAPSDDRLNIRFQEEGFASGLAFNGDGLAMAGMGIAADDANGDGRIDFFVTTFKDEPRVLYLQDATGIFVDAANGAGLRAPGWPFVGWGTQFLDADCDGTPDLVVANGHVDDYRDEGGAYHMRPQFFRNTGGGRFVELEAPDIGPWFGRKYLGRGLARLDWNRDGRMDFVVSNIGDRASLVSNVTTGSGHFLNVRLHARRTARDAIGSVVEVAAGGRRWKKQLVAGDGYMASNERLLQFGLGDAGSAQELRVVWPSGATTAIPRPPVDVTLELVEGATRGVLWRGSDPVALNLPRECLGHEEGAADGADPRRSIAPD